jgi:hypothetical protein
MVGQLDVQSQCIVVRIDRHRGHVQVVRSADQSNCNLAPIGNENFFEHGKYP